MLLSIILVNDHAPTFSQKPYSIQQINERDPKQEQIIPDSQHWLLETKQFFHCLTLMTRFMGKKITDNY